MGVRNIDVSWLYLIRQADPDFDRDRRRELAYDFQGGYNGRRFYVNPTIAGAYGDTRRYLTDNDGNVITDEYGFGITTNDVAANPILATSDGLNLVTDAGETIAVD